MLTSIAHMDFIETIQQAETVEELHGVGAKIADSFNFDHFIYGARVPISLVRPQLFVISGFPPDWWDHYKKNNYFQIDPTISHSINNSTPLLWSRIRCGPELPAESQRLMLEATEHGLKNGVSFPIHGSQGEGAVMSLTSADASPAFTEHIQQHLPILQFLTTYYHEQVRGIISVEEIPCHPEIPVLSQREKECLLWAAEGKTAWETSQILDISERTVIFHLQNASRKMNVTNRQHAIARAVALRLITPQLG